MDSAGMGEGEISTAGTEILTEVPSEVSTVEETVIGTEMILTD